MSTPVGPVPDVLRPALAERCLEVDRSRRHPGGCRNKDDHSQRPPWGDKPATDFLRHCCVECSADNGGHAVPPRRLRHLLTHLSWRGGDMLIGALSPPHAAPPSLG